MDVRSDSGRRLPVVTRDQSTYFAQSILMSGVEIDDLIYRKTLATELYHLFHHYTEPAHLLPTV